ncbi:unnamed protein product [Fraxinus pennsylvanica]|uniref:Uncharacterized protein n=1 Tax=Fraxinus pennsylvanica TaxID=56036 RepID=A0AAD2EC46_9LAMI|nr:unnamed protein product [Fraxinus pennsylvanica]
MVAKKGIASELLKSTNALKHDVRVSKGPLCNEENNWSSVKKELGFQVMENSSKFHGRIRKSNSEFSHSETGFRYFVLIENLEKDLSPSAIGEFIYKQTSISSQIYVFPSQPSEPYARGAIVLECKEDFEKIYDLLNSSSQLVVSAKGRYIVESCIYS